MKITVKCPNCFQQVASDNRYCIFCGYDLSAVSPAPAADDSIPAVSDSTAGGAAPYSGPCFCPKGHDVPDPSLGFCPVCGSPLVNEPSAGGEEAWVEAEPVPAPEPAPAPAPESRRAAANRKCSCGYVCDDPDLNFCPACGLPLDAASAEPAPAPAPEPAPSAAAGWVCECGETNASDMNFCCACGKRRGGSRRERAGRAEKDRIPDGMKPPKDDDLTVKAKYGN